MKSSEAAVSPGCAPRVIPFRPPQRRTSQELAFLPAALEIVETPPSPVGRATAATIALVFCFALLWAWWGTGRRHQGRPAIRNRDRSVDQGAGRTGR
jgi:hemolysin D